MSLLAALASCLLLAAPLASAQKSAYLRSGAKGKTIDKTPYNYEKALGDTMRFLEIQRSGRIGSGPGGGTVSWRKDQLLDDGSDVGINLAGGHYEAGNRLKISLASGFAFSRVAFSCLYYRDVYAQATYRGKSALYWCKREVRYAAQWALKSYRHKGELDGKWHDSDKFVVMVGRVQPDWGGPDPGDFDCYKRAENIPAAPNCVKRTRQTTLADSKHPAADHAAEVAGQLAAAAALLAADAPKLSQRCIKTAHALYDFAEKHPGLAVDRVYSVGFTYPTQYPETNRMWAASMLAFVHNCSGGGICSTGQRDKYLGKAKSLWKKSSTSQQLLLPINNWANAGWDCAFMLAKLTGEGQYYARIEEYVRGYIEADPNKKIGTTPKGLRTYDDLQWSSLRLATFSSYLSLFYSTLPKADKTLAKRAQCYARSQLGYIFGDTGRSYVVGSGKKFPQQVHHRDAACTLQEDAQGKCDRKSKNDNTYLFVAPRPNPYDVTGAIVGGPDADDNFRDVRNEYKFTEVAIDYNCALTCALAGVLGAQEDLFTRDCSKDVPKYPW